MIYTEKWITNKIKIDLLISLNENIDFLNYTNLRKIQYLDKRIGNADTPFLINYLNFWINRDADGFKSFENELTKDIFKNLEIKFFSTKQILKQITSYKIEFSQLSLEIVEFLNDLKKNILELNGVK